jgi:hypothetical protein
MRYLKPLMLAAMAMFAFAAVGTAVAQAEEAREPALLLLENGVSTLTAKFKGTTSQLSTLGGKELTGTGVEGTLKGCKNLGASEKDTTLCEALLTFTGVKKEKVACRSENQAATTKDAIETVLAFTDVHIANGETSSKVLVPLALFKVLGQASGEPAEELVINCGGVKEKVKGALGCEVSPGLTNIPITSEATIACKLTAGHDQEVAKCELLCEWLTEHPFESNLGNGFEDAGMAITTKGTFSKDVFLDD